MKHTDKLLSEDELVALIREQLNQDLQRIDEQILRQLDSARSLALQTEAVARSSDEETLVQISRETSGGGRELNPDIVQSLDQIRLKALARIPAKREPRPTANRAGLSLQQFMQSYWKLPAGVFASAFVLLTSLSLLDTANPPETFSGEIELALIASADEIELYENLEFYLWLFDNEFTIQQAN